jgi:uncharacterized membrane-anchored protein
MTKVLRVSCIAAFFLCAAGPVASAARRPPAQAESPEDSEQGKTEDQGSGDGEAVKVLKSVNWTVGPGKATVGNQAEVHIPEGTRFTGGDGTRKMLELMHNPTDGSELGLLTNDTLEWFVIFEFEDIGYVKDADKEKLDGNELLAALRKGNEAGNEERKRRGWSLISIDGWHTPPFYNKETNNLEWCIRGSSEGHEIVNYNTRILGRAGVMSANLLVAPEALDATLATIKGILKGFSYIQGQKYSEWKSGDKIAKYGLSALVVGGAVGLAAKMGFLAKIAASLGKLWKVIILGLAGGLAALKGLIFGKKKTPPSGT